MHFSLRDAETDANRKGGKNHALLIPDFPKECSTTFLDDMIQQSSLPFVAFLALKDVSPKSVRRRAVVD